MNRRTFLITPAVVLGAVVPAHKNRPRIVDLTMTCASCPSQWDAVTDLGQYVYIRYRHGWLSVDIDGAEIYVQQYGDQWSGVMSQPEMKSVLWSVLDFSGL